MEKASESWRGGCTNRWSGRVMSHPSWSNHKFTGLNEDAAKIRSDAEPHCFMFHVSCFMFCTFQLLPPPYFIPALPFHPHTSPWSLDHSHQPYTLCNHTVLGIRGQQDLLQASTTSWVARCWSPTCWSRRCANSTVEPYWLNPQLYRRLSDWSRPDRSGSGQTSTPIGTSIHSSGGLLANL